MPLSPVPSQRKVHPPEDFLPKSGGYQLLPFRFVPLDSKKYVLSNIVGEYCVVEREILQELVTKTLRPANAAYSLLKSRHFFFEVGETSALHLLATKYRTKQAPLAEFTSLHMIVPTLRCNTSCVYCQVSHKGGGRDGVRVYTVVPTLRLNPKRIDLILTNREATGELATGAP